MSEQATIERELSLFAKAHHEDGLWAVPTHCLYPSNGTVTAFLTGGPTNGFVVSDNGGAMRILTSRGIVLPDPDAMLMPFCRRRGLHPAKGAIVTRQVPVEALATAVIMVANASSAAAHWGLQKYKPRQHRDVKKALREVLRARYSSEHLRSHVSLIGDSTRRYTFDHVVALDGRDLVLDAVVPDGNAVNAKTIAHLDLARRNDPKLIQRIVYDEADEWRAADLNLMKSAAPIVQIGHLGASIDQLRGVYAYD